MAASDSRPRGGDRRAEPSRPGRRARPGARRRERRGTLERPIDTRLVRVTSLLLLGPLLLLLVAVGRPGPFPASALPPSFDGAAAAALARELARDHPNRRPGSLGAPGAAEWVEETLARYGLESSEDAWEEAIPGLGRVRLRNLVTVVPGATTEAIVVLAHRDNTGVAAGANDNASGTAALIELARGYGRLGTVAGRPQPMHTLVFLSTDGGAYGGYGAERYATTSPLRDRIRALVVLDGLAGSAPPRIELSAYRPRTPTPALLRTVDARVEEQLGEAPSHPGPLVQLVDLAVPFGYGEQAPFLTREISAVRLSTAPDNASGAALDTVAILDAPRFARLGRAAESILASLDAGVELVGGTAAHVYLGSRTVRGWAIQLVLLTAVLPFLAGVVDLVARCRRRRLAFAGALRALRLRLGVWLWAVLLLGAGALAGVFPRDSPIPPAPDSPAVSDWPVAALAVLAGLWGLGWWRARRTLAAQVHADPDEALAGYAVSLLVLGGVAAATAIVSPYGLLFVLPSLYAWLWLPQLGAGWRRDVLYGAGLAGPVLAAVAIGTQLELGWSTPLYVASLMTLGFVPWTTVLILAVWAAVATQLAALTAGRYAPVGGRPRTTLRP